MPPLVTIVTATRGYSEMLLKVCIPSVQTQTYSNIEHVIVSEPDSRLRDVIPSISRRFPIRYFETGPGRGQRNFQYDQPGAAAYGLGASEAWGEYIGYCGDDDELLPQHTSTMVNILAETGAAFATSIAEFRVGGVRKTLIGDGTLRLCTLDTISIVHRRSCISVANWDETRGVADWQLVTDWKDAGLPHVHEAKVTCIHNDGRYAEVSN
jgi:glycosyltransferase involved in cell wall biosynthesis